MLRFCRLCSPHQRCVVREEPPALCGKEMISTAVRHWTEGKTVGGDDNKDLNLGSGCEEEFVLPEALILHTGFPGSQICVNV